MRAIERIREYRESHGTAYTLKRLGQKAAQQLLGTYDRRWRREKATEAELQRQRENQPEAGLISLVIPVYNYSVPENECAGTTDDDPCSLFGRIRFPVEEFYHPDRLEQNESYRGLMQ